MGPGPLWHGETRGFAVHDDVSMDLIEVFQDSDDLQDFSAGSVVMKEGEEGDRMFVVIEGKVTISLEGRTLATAGPGEIVGEMALINSRIRSATVTAASDCKLAPIEQKSFEALLRHVPDFSVYVIHVLAARLQSAYDMIEH